jgi:membrane protein DedA with SNARE-associated domain
MSFSLIGTLVAAIVLVLTVVGLPGLFALTAVESFGIPPIPSEVILTFAGFLVADGTFSFGAAWGVAVVGELTGAFVAYSVGRWWRDRLAGAGVGHLRLRTSDLDKMDRWFRERGEVTVALSRLVPIVRGYVSYPAGTARMNPVRFGLYTVLGSAPYSLALIYAGYVLGSRWYIIDNDLQPFDIVFAALLIVAVVYLVLVASGYVRWGWPPHRGPRYTTRPPEGADAAAGPREI